MNIIINTRLIIVPLILLLCSMQILTGCFSYSAITREAGSPEDPAPDDDIRILTVDGQTIESDAYHFMAVRERTSFIYGIGIRYRLGATGSFSPYHGVIDTAGEPTEVPSLSRAPHESMVVFRIHDDSSLRIRKSDLLIIDSSKETGLWCIGREFSKEGLEKSFSGRIPFNQVQRIEERKLSVTRTLLVSCGAVALSVGFIAVAGAAVGGWGLLTIP